MLATLLDRPLWQKLMVLFLLVGVIPMTIVEQRSVSRASHAMDAQLGETLAGLRDAKAMSVRAYFNNRRSEIQLLATAPQVVAGAQHMLSAFSRVTTENQIDAVQLSRYKAALRSYYVEEFGAEFKKRNQTSADTASVLDLLSPEAITLQYFYIRANQHPLGSKHLLDAAPDASTYSRAHAETHGFLRSSLTAFGYYDVFLIDPTTGNIIYSVYKELDFATNLSSGPWSQTNLADAFRKARTLKRGESVLVDFARYRPSYDDPAGFMAAPIYAHDKLIAIVAIQMPLEPMNAIMNDHSGLGATGESFLVGADKLMRSDSAFSQAHRVKTSFANPEHGRVDSAAATAALEGRAGTINDVNFAGEPVHAAFGTIDLDDFKWAIVASQGDAEALAPIKAMQRDNLLLAALLMATVALMAWLLGRVVAKPIVALRNLIVTVEQTGEFQQPTLRVSQDEIGQTVRAFDSLLGVMKGAFSDANQVLSKVVKGEYTATQASRYRGDIQRLAQGIDATVEQLRFGQEKQLRQQRDIEAAATTMQQKAEENEALARDAAEEADRANRVKQALDTCATPVMMTNDARQIVYANCSAERLISRLQSAFQTRLPSFRASGLLGTSLDTLCMDSRPGKDAGNLAGGGLEMNIAGNTLRVIRSPITKDGKQVGEVAEWLDRTAEVAIESSIATLLAAASRGDFEVKVDEGGLEGFYLELGKGLNALVDTTRMALDDFKRVMGQMAQGDLSCRIDKQYSGTFGQLSNNVNLTLEKISEVVDEITESASAVANSAAEIHAGVADLSRRTEQQAASLEETASSMDEMTASVKHSAQNASSVLELSKQADEFARAGSEVVGRAVSSMEGISKASKEIADIIGVIDGIAFQTNLLALNAAVEAARAGEQGRGFAVVAAEVRMLAQRSAQAAKEIKGLISDSVTKVNAGHALVTESGNRLRDILSAVDRVAKEVIAIAGASKEQAAGISQVNTAISAMDESTQQNSALVEQATAAAESMAGNARGMVQAVSFFRLGN